jgi:hypothetical protein
MNETRRLAWLMALWLSAPAAMAGDVWIKRGWSEVVGDQLTAGANVSYSLSDEALEALSNGVSLTFTCYFRLQRERNYWQDEVIAKNKQRRKLTYRPLSNQFTVSDNLTADRRHFQSLEDAVAYISDIHGLPLVQASALDNRSHYTVRARAEIEIRALPSPLNVLAYFYRDWWLWSDWHTWNLKL